MAFEASCFCWGVAPLLGRMGPGGAGRKRCPEGSCQSFRWPGQPAEARKA